MNIGRLGDQLALAGTTRYRAAERRQLVMAARQDAIGAIAIVATNVAWMWVLEPSRAVTIVIANVAIGLVAWTMRAALAGPARHHPAIVVAAALASIDGAALVFPEFYPALAPIAVAWSLLIPAVVAAAVPWSSAAHVRWLGLHLLFAAPRAIVTGGAVLGASGPIWMIGLLGFSAAVSLLGHLTARRLRIEAFRFNERSRDLNAELRADRQQLRHLNAVLNHESRTDDLTGAGNRLAFAGAIDMARGRIARHGESYGLVLFDLDSFKAVNDTFGHVAGDEALRRCAGAARSALRAGDELFRFGGDEFLILGRVTDATETAGLAERLRGAIESLRIPDPANPPHGAVTASIGTMTIGPADLGLSEDQWFRAADAAVYEAKAHGRNRTVAAARSASGLGPPQIVHT